MQNNVVARKLVKVYGISYHIELRKEKNFEGRTIYRLYNVYDLDYPICEEPRGFRCAERGAGHGLQGADGVIESLQVCFASLQRFTSCLARPLGTLHMIEEAEFLRASDRQSRSCGLRLKGCSIGSSII